MAIGHNTVASAGNAVALGSGSVADRANSVSVGSAGNERQITNVAAGTALTDAVNLGQLNDRWDRVNDTINRANRQANRGIAAASALMSVTPYLPGHTGVNAGFASYRGQNAVGVNVSRWTENGRINVNAGVSAAQGDSPIYRVGVGVVF